MNIISLIEKEGRLAEDLRRAAKDLGIRITTVRWSDLRANMRTDDQTVRAGDMVLNHADAILLRTMRAGTFEQVFFRMDMLHRLGAAGPPIVNPPRAVEVSVDKYMAQALVRDAGLATPDTVVCQKLTDAIEAFDALGGDVVLKPLFGSEGFGITRISDRALAQRAFAQLERMGQVAYVQRFVPHDGSDFRLFVLGGRVLGSMRRRGQDWPANIALGGRGEPVVPPPAISAMALRAAQACGALMAGVDVLVSDGGEPYVLEVNAIPGWRELAEVTGIDVTRQVLTFIVGEAEQKHASP